MSRFIRFRDIKERGIVANWPQLRNLIEKYGFPPGRLLGPQTRVWDEEAEIEPWLASRPTRDPSRRRSAVKAGKSVCAAEAIVGGGA